MAHQVTSKDIPINGEHLEKGKIATLQMICGGIGGIGSARKYHLFGQRKW